MEFQQPLSINFIVLSSVKLLLARDSTKSRQSTIEDDNDQLELDRHTKATPTPPIYFNVTLTFDLLDPKLQPLRGASGSACAPNLVTLSVPSFSPVRKERQGDGADRYTLLLPARDRNVLYVDKMMICFAAQRERLAVQCGAF